MDNLLELHETVMKTIPCLRVSGEIDINSISILRQRLDQIVDRGATHLVVDLTDVRYIDSTGLGALVACSKRLQAVNGKVSLICKSPHILKLLHITGLGPLFELCDSQAQVRSVTHVNTVTASS